MVKLVTVRIHKRLGFNPGLGRPPEAEHCNPSIILAWRILMDRRAWWATKVTEHACTCTQGMKSESVSHSVMSNSLQLHGLYSPLGSAIHGISQARILVAISCSRGSSQPRDQTWVSQFTRRFFKNLYKMVSLKFFLKGKKRTKV